MTARPSSDSSDRSDLPEADYIIVGAGSAGCALANKLTACGRHRVLLIEAGPVDRHPYVHMPKGMAKLFADPRHVHSFQTDPSEEVPAETWIRGKVLGGSSSINGMMYFHGHPEDYNEWERLGARGWGWDNMERVFREIEAPNDAATNEGSVGPLKTTIAGAPTPLTEAFIRAGEQLGVPRVPDLNHAGQEGVGYPARTIHGGRRQSAATAFLTPILGRSNLQVVTDVEIDRILFDGNRACAVLGRRGNKLVKFRSKGEIILSAGALSSPQILERSGVGPATHLQALGIPVVCDSPGVGENLAEHRLLMMQYALLKPLSDNFQFKGWRLLLNMLKYYLTRTGPMTDGSYQAGAFVKTNPDFLRPDSEVLMASYSVAFNVKGMLTTDSSHSIHLFGYPLRPISRGSIHIQSAEPDTPPSIRPNYLSEEYDQEVTIALFRLIRRWIAQPALQEIIGKEILPGSEIQTDEEIIREFKSTGQAGYHACGTARMGGAGSVLDERLRVRGVVGLRVADGSVMPNMVSANTNGPIMAIGWRAGELILQDCDQLSSSP